METEDEDILARITADVDEEETGIEKCLWFRVGRVNEWYLGIMKDCVERKIE